jgi:hypothetical protein
MTVKKESDKKSKRHDFVVESGVGIPKLTRRRGPSPLALAMSKLKQTTPMSTGESILVPCPPTREGEELARRRIYSARDWILRNMDDNERFKTRVQEGGIRVWRLKKLVSLEPK